MTEGRPSTGQIITAAVSVVGMLGTIITVFFGTANDVSSKVERRIANVETEQFKQGKQLDVLAERSGQHSANFTNLNELVAQMQANQHKQLVDIIDKLLARERARPSDAVFRMISESEHIETLKDLKYSLEQSAPKTTSRELDILRELNVLTAKERKGELTEEEALDKGALEDELGQLKQKQILDSLRLRSGSTTLDCELCKRLCGPLI